jgi:hypothetical protein
MDLNKILLLNQTFNLHLLQQSLNFLVVQVNLLLMIPDLN